MRSIPDGFVADLMALLAIPGVAAWNHAVGDLEQAASWLHDRLEQSGLKSTLLRDELAPPYVYAESRIRPERTTLLLYGHYDVQPAAADGWTSDPFKPEMRNGRIYGRGATDQKMNLLLPVFALEEVDLDLLPWNIKVFMRGTRKFSAPAWMRPCSNTRSFYAVT